MALFNFFKTPRHQRYNYIPRYWDPEKEEREARMKELDRIKDKDDIEGMKARISSGLKRKSRISSSYRKKQMMRSNLILFAVIVFLLIASYVIIAYYLPTILEALE